MEETATIKQNNFLTLLLETVVVVAWKSSYCRCSPEDSIIPQNTLIWNSLNTGVMIIEIPRRCWGSLIRSGILRNSCFIPFLLRVFQHVVDFYHKVHDYKNQDKSSNTEKLGSHDWSTSCSGCVFRKRREKMKGRPKDDKLLYFCDVRPWFNAQIVLPSFKYMCTLLILDEDGHAMGQCPTTTQNLNEWLLEFREEKNDAELCFKTSGVLLFTFAPFPRSKNLK